MDDEFISLVRVIDGKLIRIRRKSIIALCQYGENTVEVTLINGNTIRVFGLMVDIENEL